MSLLGNKVKDKISGFGGIVVESVEYLNGCIQYFIRPKAKKDGKFPMGEWIDQHQLKTIKKGAVPLVSLIYYDIELGEQVVDSVTGYKGIATTVSRSVNGITYFCVKRKIGKDGKMPDGHYVHPCRLSVVGRKVKTKIAKTGGPLPDYPKER